MLIVAVVFLLLVSLTSVIAEDNICGVYITGIGCPHCAKSDPILLKSMVPKYDNLIIIEYEIYQKRENALLLSAYNDFYESSLGIPKVIFSKEKKIIGDSPIVNNIEWVVSGLESNPCPLLDGGKSFEDIQLNDLHGIPSIWRNNRILIRESKDNKDNELFKKLLLNDDVEDVLKSKYYEIVEAEPVALSGSKVEFDNAIRIDGWLFQWNGKEIPDSIVGENSAVNGNATTQDILKAVTLTKVLSLAAVDAINPCALAMLTLMLVAIITYNPTKKRKILLAGLAFTASVFIMYIFYGVVIIRLFQIVQVITNIRLVLYKFLGGAALILGFLEIKDFLFYRAGSFATEMPMGLRPKLKKLISKITSPSGAFVIGAFVTLFLLPCTIGPYVILGGILSVFDIIKTIPLLIIYNLVFVLPMLIITGIVYFGISRVEDVSGWKDKNIKILHLISGIIIFALGLAMIMGWV